MGQVISYVCQLVLIAVGLVSAYQQQERLYRRVDLVIELEQQGKYDEASSLSRELERGVGVEEQDEGDALLISLVGAAALFTPLVLTGIILTTGGAPDNTAGDASSERVLDTTDNPTADAEAEADPNDKEAARSTQ